jgi:Na+/melibiose symporter-like transporter
LLAPFVPALAKRFGKYPLYIFSIIWFVVFSVVIYFVGYENYTLFMVLTLLKNVGFGLTSVMMFMFTPDCVEYGTFKTGDRAEGITFSLQTFTTKLMTGLATTLGMAGLAMFGFVEGQGITQTAQTIDGIWLMYSLFPAIGALLSLIVLSTYKLRDKHVQVMARANQGEITREEAFAQLPEEFHYTLD